MSDGSNIPAARERLEWAAKGMRLGLMSPEQAAAMIEGEVLPLMTRRAPKRRAQTQSERMSDELSSRIRDYAAANPDEPQSEIAARFKVNPGRVSEALNEEPQAEEPASDTLALEATG